MLLARRLTLITQSNSAHCQRELDMLQPLLIGPRAHMYVLSYIESWSLTLLVVSGKMYLINKFGTMNKVSNLVD